MTKQELLELGITEDVAEKIVADYGKNYVSKGQFNEKLNELKTFKENVATLESVRDELQGKLASFTNAGANSGADIAKLQKEIQTLQEQYESEQKLRQEAEDKRVQSEITTQVVDALTKHHAVDPGMLSKLLIPHVSVGEDGTYAYTNGEGKTQTIEDGAKAWLQNNMWAVKSTQKPGSGHNKGGQSNDGEPKSLRGLIASSLNVPEN